MIIPNIMLGKSLHGLWFHGPALTCLIWALQSLCKYQPYNTCLKSHLTALPSQTASAGKGDFGRERHAAVWEQSTREVSLHGQWCLQELCQTGLKEEAKGMLHTSKVRSAKRWCHQLGIWGTMICILFCVCFYCCFLKTFSGLASERFGPAGKVADPNI